MSTIHFTSEWNYYILSRGNNHWKLTELPARIGWILQNMTEIKNKLIVSNKWFPTSKSNVTAILQMSIKILRQKRSLTFKLIILFEKYYVSNVWFYLWMTLYKTDMNENIYS